MLPSSVLFSRPGNLPWANPKPSTADPAQPLTDPANSLKNTVQPTVAPPKSSNGGPRRSQVIVPEHSGIAVLNAVPIDDPGSALAASPGRASFTRSGAVPATNLQGVPADPALGAIVHSALGASPSPLARDPSAATVAVAPITAIASAVDRFMILASFNQQGMGKSILSQPSLTFSLHGCPAGFCGTIASFLDQWPYFYGRQRVNYHRREIILLDPSGVLPLSDLLAHRF